SDKKETRNSFDLVVLSEAGRAATQVLHGEKPEGVAQQVLQEQVRTLAAAPQERPGAIADLKLGRDDIALLKRRAAEAESKESKPLGEDEQMRVAEIESQIAARSRERMVEAMLPATTARLKDQWFFTSPAFQ